MTTWLNSGGRWAAAVLDGLTVDDDGALVLAGTRRGTAELTVAGEDVRRLRVRLADPVPDGCWIRVWTAAGSGPWRAAPAGALDVWRPAGPGPLRLALELAGDGSATPRIADVAADPGADGPVTELPVAYRGDDDGDGPLGRLLGLVDTVRAETVGLLDELPSLLDPGSAADRPDAPWLARLAEWVAVETGLPAAGADVRRGTVAGAVARHATRGTRAGLIDALHRETGVRVRVREPLLDTHVWRLGGTRESGGGLGRTTGLAVADPGPPVLDATAVLDGSMLVGEPERGLPVHDAAAHRICVHVPAGQASRLAAVDAVVQRERPAHVHARTCVAGADPALPQVLGGAAIPPSRTGLPHDTGTRIGARLRPDRGDDS